MKKQKGHDFIETAMYTDDEREIAAIVSKIPKQHRTMFTGIAIGYAAALEIDKPPTPPTVPAAAQVARAL